MEKYKKSEIIIQLLVYTSWVSQKKGNVSERSTPTAFAR